MKDDNFILINEVGLRDGLQGVSQEVTIEQRSVSYTHLTLPTNREV